MPIYQVNPNQQQKKKALGVVSGAPSLSGPSFGGGAAPQGAGKSGGSGWVNLQTYLGLNQGAGQQMANTLAGGVEKKGQAAQDAAGALSKEHWAQTSADTKAGATGQPGSMASMSGFGEVAKQTADASRDAQALGGGFDKRQNLVAQQFGQGASDYSGGMGRWDNFAAGASDDGRFGAAASKYGGLDKELGLTVGRADTIAQQHRDTYQATEAQKQAKADADAAAAAEQKQRDEDMAFYDEVAAYGKSISGGIGGLGGHAFGDWQRDPGTEKWAQAEIEKKFGPGSWARFKREQQRRQQAFGASMTSGPGGGATSGTGGVNQLTGITGGKN